MPEEQQSNVFLCVRTHVCVVCSKMGHLGLCEYTLSYISQLCHNLMGPSCECHDVVCDLGLPNSVVGAKTQQ